MKKNKIIEFLNDTANGNYSVEIANKMSGNVKRMPHNHINVLYMLRELMGDKCKNYLEIGVYYGASFILVMQNKYPCNFVGIDFFDKVRYGENVTNDVNPIADVRNVINSVNEHNYNYDLIQGDSTDIDIVTQVKDKIKDGIDLLFIDGNHEPDGLLADFNNYKDLVNSGGFIVFDDYGFLPDVKNTVDDIDFSGFEVIGEIDMHSGNTPGTPGKNASYIVYKK